MWFGVCTTLPCLDVSSPRERPRLTLHVAREAHNMAKPHRTYYGANVRIETQGTSLDGSLVVQWYSETATDWIEARRFYQSEDYCYSEAREFASTLAAHLLAVAKARKMELEASP